MVETTAPSTDTGKGLSKLQEILNSIGSTDGNKKNMLKVDAAPGSNLEKMLVDIKKVMGLQAGYLSKIVDYQNEQKQKERLASASGTVAEKLQPGGDAKQPSMISSALSGLGDILSKGFNFFKLLGLPVIAELFGKFTPLVLGAITLAWKAMKLVVKLGWLGLKLIYSNGKWSSERMPIPEVEVPKPGSEPRGEGPGRSPSGPSRRGGTGLDDEARIRNSETSSPRDFYGKTKSGQRVKWNAKAGRWQLDYGGRGGTGFVKPEDVITNTGRSGGRQTFGKSIEEVATLAEKKAGKYGARLAKFLRWSGKILPAATVILLGYEAITILSDPSTSDRDKKKLLIILFQKFIAGWALMELGAALGGLIGAMATSETGPGAAVGGLLGGMAGFGASFLVPDKIYEAMAGYIIGEDVKNVITNPNLDPNAIKAQISDLVQSTGLGFGAPRSARTDAIMSQVSSLKQKLDFASRVDTGMRGRGQPTPSNILSGYLNMGRWGEAAAEWSNEQTLNVKENQVDAQATRTTNALNNALLSLGYPDVATARQAIAEATSQNRDRQYAINNLEILKNSGRSGPQVVVMGGRADRDQQGSVTTVTNIYQTKDPAASLASQMPGGGISDIPIFNWGY